MRLAVLALLLAPTLAQAGDWLVFSVSSFHFDRSNEYKEFNPGIGFERELNARWSLVGGAYSNSFGDLSAYAGATYMPWQWRSARFGTVMGLVSGYGSKLMPVLLPAMTIEDERVGVNIVMAPKTGSSPGGFGFQVKWAW